MTERRVRVRFAPSPTGALHIGGVRTALYNYLFARQHGGDMIFRIEDTDSNRFVPGAEEYILESFKWLGIPFDEGVSFGGKYGPYRQSERREIYKKYVKVLLENDKAYIAFDTPEELDAKRAEIANFQYDASTRMQMRNSLTLSKEEVDALIAEGKQYVVRFKIEPNEDVHVNDLIRGEVIINSSILDDKVLYKSADELPTYHLANIVDDHLMEVSHVIRGEEQRVNRFFVTEYLIFYAFILFYALGIKSERKYVSLGFAAFVSVICSSLRRCIAHWMEAASGIGAAEISGTDRVISRIIFHDFCIYGELYPFSGTGSFYRLYFVF